MIAASNLFSLATLVHDLVTVGVKNGTSLLVAALQVWLTNVTVSGLAYWEMDRGGPVSRTQAPREELPMADSASPRTRTTTPSRKPPTDPAPPLTGSPP